jgi:hypothetical protein
MLSEKPVKGLNPKPTQAEQVYFYSKIKIMGIIDTGFLCDVALK